VINRAIIAKFSFFLIISVAFFLASAPTYAAGTATTFSENYQLWDASSDIRLLQQFFNSEGFVVAENGPGSPVDGTRTLSAVAKNSVGNYATSSITVTVDNNAPAISAISSGTSTFTSTTITWTTDKPADSQVAYGTSVSYTASTTLDSSFVTSHSVTIIGLATSTTYHFQVLSREAGGNLATSSDQTFVTATTATSTFRGFATAGDGTDTETYPINIGSASSDHMVIVGVLIQNGSPITSLVVNGISLSLATSTAGGTTSFWYGLVPTGSGTQNVVLNTSGAAYQERDIMVWTANGLLSNTLQQTGGTPPSPSSAFAINVSANDLPFAISFGSTADTFTASTQVPAEVLGPAGSFGGGLFGLDWLIRASNNAFSVQANSGSHYMAGVTFR
jgi:hypothetical protein